MGNGREFWTTTGYDTIKFPMFEYKKDQCKIRVKLYIMKLFTWFLFWENNTFFRGGYGTSVISNMKLFLKSGRTGSL